MSALFTGLRLFVILSLITGVAYPLLITAISQLVWPDKANGSLVIMDNQVRGSYLIAQKFQDPKYFWPRPSATDYNANASAGSNRGPTDAGLKKIYDEGKKLDLSDEMIFSSASGLDPHISPETTQFYFDSVATARNLSLTQREELVNLIASSVENRGLGFLGQPRVNVLKLNLAMDELFGKKQETEISGNNYQPNRIDLK